MKKTLLGTWIGITLLAVAPSGRASLYTWDVNGAIGGYNLTCYGNPMYGDWDDASTNWTLIANGDGATVAWPNISTPTGRDGAAFKYRYQNPVPGSALLPDILVNLVGTRYVGITQVELGTYAVWTNGAVNLATSGTAMQVGFSSSNNTLHVFSDFQLGGDNTTVAETLYVGSSTDPKSLNNSLLFEGAIYASGPTAAVSLTLKPVAYSSGDSTKVVLKSGSVISNGTASSLDVNFGSVSGNVDTCGRVEIYSVNTYTGASYLFGGKTVVYTDSLNGQAGAFGNSSSWLQTSRSQTSNTNTVQLLTGAGGVTIGRSIQLRKGLSNNTTYGVIIGGEHTSGVSTYSGLMDLTMETYDRTTDVYLTSAAGGTVDFTGAIRNGVGGSNTPITKIGLGTVRLAAANTYSGPTTVTEGTLLVNGSIGTGAVTVAAGGTLGGTGTVNGATTVNGTLSPGQSPGGLTFNRDLTLAGTSTNYFEINGASDPNIDFVVVNGALAYGGILSVHFGYTPAPDASFQLFDFSGSQSGAFSDILVTGDYTGAVDFDVATGVLTVIPEPGTLGILSIGLIATLLRRRMRNA